ncbi:PREDICTED: uncharacterized protein LOC105456142, partial [Wasmannia auropunctata]|uniref:uncharacterized protein LOC105456142 n=1 Tax=Wasmannia auropunctata TaxID=64793 RepID=UPI0005EF7CD7
MTDEKNSSNTKKSDNLSGDDIDHEDESREKMIVTPAWSIVHFDTDDENNLDSFNDLVPSSWISTLGTMCWYPMNKHQGTIQKLVKQCAKLNSEWDCFPIRKIEEGIENYERGMKMLVKLSKNPNASLHSDFEEKGKGKRVKKINMRFVDSDKENNVRKKKQQNMLPPVPKLSDFSQTSHDKVDATMNWPSEHGASSDLNNLPPWPNSSSRTKPIKDNFPIKERTLKPETSKAEKAVTSSNKGCKIRSNIHKCAYVEGGEVTLQSVADVLCYLSAEVKSCNLLSRKTDRNMETFLQTVAVVTKKPENDIVPAVDVIKELPLKNLEELRAVE